MNNIEKLAIEHGKASNTVMRYNEMSQQMLLDGYNFTRSELEAFAKALQSSEPVAECGVYMGDADDEHGIFSYKPFNGSPLVSGETKLFTLPPSTVRLEEHNKRIAELVEALERAREMVGHEDNIAFIDAAIAKVKGK